jgi:hypothetical protein
MDRDLQVKLAVYGHFAESGRRPSPLPIGSASLPKMCSTRTGASEPNGTRKRMTSVRRSQCVDE